METYQQNPAYTKPPRTGLEAFALMPEGTLCQLINDNIVMSPAPSTPHQEILDEIYEQLKKFVKSRLSGKTFFAPVDVYLNNKNVYQPDILFLNNDQLSFIKRKGIYGAPALIIEVLSEGTYQYDLGDKKEIYEQSGVKEYWAIDSDTKICKGFILKNDKFQSLAETKGSFEIRMFNLSIQL